MSNSASTQSSRTSSSIDAGVRKRVSKACDRCRMKKAECDGASPCGKCKMDDSICAYGKRKRSTHDKVYTKGYVEMLEQQRAQLVLGLQELYRRSIQQGEGPDSELVLPHTSPETVPSTHDLLAWLGALDQDKLDTIDNFYEDFNVMHAVAMLEDPASMNRRTSFDSISVQPDIDQTPPLEAVNVPGLGHRGSSASFFTQSSLMESPPLLPANTRSAPTVPTTTEATQTFSQILWHPEPMELQVMNSDINNPWIYDGDTQAMFAGTQMNAFQQPMELSINPFMTLKDWPTSDMYPFDRGFLHT